MFKIGNIDIKGLSKFKGLSKEKGPIKDDFIASGNTRRDFVKKEVPAPEVNKIKTSLYSLDEKRDLIEKEVSISLNKIKKTPIESDNAVNKLVKSYSFKSPFVKVVENKNE